MMGGALPELLSVDLATLEQRVQQVGRVLLGGLIERVAAGHGGAGQGSAGFRGLADAGLGRRRRAGRRAG